MKLPLIFAASLAALASPAMAKNDGNRIISSTADRPVWAVVIGHRHGSLSVPHLMNESACRNGIQEIKDTSRTSIDAFCINTQTGDILWPWS